MYKKYIKLTGVIKNASLVFMVGIIIFTLGLVFYYKTYAVNSDDVAQKAVLSQVFSQNDIWVPADHFMLKAPINLVVDALVHSPTKNIFVSSWVMNVIMLLLFFLTARYFLKKYANYGKAVTTFHTAFLYMCAVGGGYLASLASPQYRNLEIGVAFSFLWFIDRHINPLAAGRLTPRRIAVPVFGAMAFGLFIYSDPAFFVYLAGPLGLTAAIYVLIKRKYRLFLPLTVFLTSSLVFFKFISKFFALLGVHTYSAPTAFVPWDRFGSNISAMVQSLLFLQNSSFSDLPLASPHSLLVILNALLLFIVVIVLPVYLYRQKKFWLTFMILQPAFLMLTFILSSAVYPNTTSVRYLVLLPFYGVVVTAWASESLSKSLKRTLYVLLGTAIIGNAGWTAKNVIRLRHDHPNAYNQKISRMVQDNDVQKGYAPYWNAGITGFWTDYNVDVFPITYSKTNKDEISPYYININVKAMQEPAEKSFIIVSNYPGALPESQTELQAQYSTQGVFRAESARKQFGQPTRVLGVTAFTSIYIYDYDLLNIMPSRADYTDAQQ